MWWRRVEIGICRPMMLGFYYSEALETVGSRFKCYPEQADAQKEIARTGMRWLEGVMNESWLAGERFTAADICLYSYIDCLCEAGQPIPDDLPRLSRWYQAVGERSAAHASICEEPRVPLRG
jgi:glutathione S-transferase